MSENRYRYAKINRGIYRIIANGGGIIRTPNSGTGPKFLPRQMVISRRDPVISQDIARYSFSGHPGQGWLHVDVTFLLMGTLKEQRLHFIIFAARNSGPMRGARSKRFQAFDQAVAVSSPTATTTEQRRFAHFRARVYAHNGVRRASQITKSGMTVRCGLQRPSENTIRACHFRRWRGKTAVIFPRRRTGWL